MPLTPRTLIIGAALIAALAVYVFRVTAGTGPMDLPTAERLVRQHLKFERNRVDVIIPDGELAHAPPAAILDARAVGCPELGSSLGTLPGRYGLGERTYGSAAFACLFAGASPSGVELRFSAHIWRSADPSVRHHNGGHILAFLPGSRTRALLDELDVASPGESHANLWVTLAAEDIYVPADTSQKSPLQRALDAHSRRISSD